MKQTVTLTRLADRHSHPTSEGREFAETCEVTVDAGSLPELLRAAADSVEDDPIAEGPARWSIAVSEPYS